MPEKNLSSGSAENRTRLVNKSTAATGTNINRVIIFEIVV